MIILILSGFVNKQTTIITFERPHRKFGKYVLILRNLHLCSNDYGVTHCGLLWFIVAAVRRKPNSGLLIINVCM